MEYSTAMRHVADLIEQRRLNEARAALRTVLREHPGDRRAAMVLAKIDEASGSVSSTSGAALAGPRRKAPPPAPSVVAPRPPAPPTGWRPAVAPIPRRRPGPPVRRPASSDATDVGVLAKVRAAVEEVTGIAPDDADDDLPLEVELDELDLIELTFALEERFGTAISDRQAARLGEMSPREVAGWLSGR